MLPCAVLTLQGSVACKIQCHTSTHWCSPCIYSSLVVWIVHVRWMLCAPHYVYFALVYFYHFNTSITRQPLSVVYFVKWRGVVGSMFVYEWQIWTISQASCSLVTRKQRHKLAWPAVLRKWAGVTVGSLCVTSIISSWIASDKAAVWYALVMLQKAISLSLKHHYCTV